MKRSNLVKPASKVAASTRKRNQAIAVEPGGSREMVGDLAIPIPVRVLSPFRCRMIEATPEQARISRQVRRTMNLYKAAKADLARRARQEWKRKATVSLLGEVEMLESTIAGVASWCEGVRTHPDPSGAIKKMFFYNIPALSRRLSGYPQLQKLLLADMKLRGMVAEFLEKHRLDQPR
jgi:hypothetical protein